MEMLRDPPAHSGIDEAALDRAVRQFPALLNHARDWGWHGVAEGEMARVIRTWRPPIVIKYRRIMMGDWQ